MGKLGIDFANEVAEKAQKKQAKYEYFKVETKPKRFRVLTMDAPAFVLTYAKHFVTFKNGWFRSYSCPDFNESGKSTCEVCRAKKGPGEGVLSDNFGTKFMMQVIERGNEEKNEPDKVKVFEVSPFLWTTLFAYYKEYGDLGDRDYEISMTKIKEGKKEKTQYIVTPCSKKPMPLSDEDDELAATRANLEDIEPKYDANDFLKIQAMEKTDGAADKTKVKEALNEFLGDSKEDAEEDDILKSLPKAKKSAPVEEEDSEDEVPAKKKVVASDDEDDDDDDEDNTEFFKTLKKHRTK